MLTNNYDSSFCFWVFEKRLTQENCFLFVKSMVCLIVLFFNNQEIFTALLSKLSWSAFGGGGQDLSISYLKQNCFSDGEGSFKESIHKQFYSK